MKIKRGIIALGAVVLFMGAKVSFSEPGSESDPLVTFSYVERKIDQLKVYVDEKLEENVEKLEENIEKPVENIKEEVSWEVLQVEAGKFLLCRAGTELILRSGQGEAVSNVGTIIVNGVEEAIENGLADVTNGKDLTMGVDIPRDHLLIAPRDDGRGVFCTSDSFFLIKGDYEIK